MLCVDRMGIVMDKLKQLLEETMNEKLLRIIVSGSKDKQQAEKLTVRPMEKRGKIVFQQTLYKGTQVFHTTLEASQMIREILRWMGTTFRQMELDSSCLHATVLVSKKGTVTIKRKAQCLTQDKSSLAHNRKKNYLLEEGKPVDYLVRLGVMTKEGKVVNSRFDKFRQINRFLEFVEDILPQLPKDREITILDFGCGKSYLTFAIYHYLKVLKHYDVRIIGLDLKQDVIEKCSQMAKEFGYEKLTFLQGDIADYEGVGQVDMVVTLHACDTATDYALAKAVKWNAKVILSVPCCQHQMNKEIRCQMLEPVFKYGIVKERTAALFTDGMRASLLEQKGYRTQLLEFIDMEHTPKNILIRAIYTGERTKDREAYEQLKAFLGAAPLLEQLFIQEENSVEEKA